MLNRSLTPLAIVILLGTGPWPPARAFNQESASPASQPNVHLEGCLFTEAGLTATAPVIIPAGSTQTYILTNAKVIAGSVSEDEVAKTTYALSYADQEELRSFHGKRVGVVGRAAASPERPKLDVVSIREISGGCPTLPGRS